MNYSPEELDILNEENLYQEMMQDAFSSTDMQPASIVDLMASDNGDVFYRIDEMVADNKNLSLSFGNKKGVPYYKVAVSDDETVTLYINQEIIKYLYAWLRDGKRIGVPEFTNVHKNATEKYLLYLIRFDRQNGAMRYNEKTREYKAIYPHGTIHYGQLPYTTQELIEKLNSLS